MRMLAVVAFASAACTGGSPLAPPPAMPSATAPPPADTPPVELPIELAESPQNPIAFARDAIEILAPRCAGPAHADLVALFEPPPSDAELTPCFAAAAPSHDLLDDPQAPSPAVAAVERACVQLASRVAAAARHDDGCSPYLVGVRDPRDDLAVLSVTRAILITARATARSGDRVAAADRLIDGIRVFQDESRGGVPLVRAYASALARADLAKQLAVVTSGLDTHALTALAARLANVVGREPSIAIVFAAERIQYPLDTIASRLGAYVPPAGFRADLDRSPFATEVERAGAFESWHGMDEASAFGVASCGGDLRACVEAFDREAEVRLEPDLVGTTEGRTRLERGTGVQDDRALVTRLIQQRATLVLAAAMLQSRIHVHAPTDACPAPDALLSPLPTAARALIHIEVAEDGLYFSVPAWLSKIDPTPIAAHVDCRSPGS